MPPPLLQLNNFTLSVGSDLLLEGVSAQLVEGQRVVLTAPNGAGKSTLLRALRGAVEGDYFHLAGGAVTGTLAAGSRPPGSVLLVEQDNLKWSDLLPSAEADEEELRELTVADALDLAAAAGDEAAVEDAEAWRRLTVAADKALGWRDAAYGSTPVGRLSPGCAVRAFLAVALQRLDVKLLLLDEPTNHLDLPSALWLQEALRASGKAVVFVSHDAAFADAVADHVWDLDPVAHTLAVSGAGLAAYRRAKALAREQQRAAYEAQQERHKKLTAAADQLRAASAKGERHVGTDHDLLQRDFRRDRAGRSGKKAKAVEALRDREARVDKVVDKAPLRIGLEAVPAGDDATITLGEAVLGYEGKPLPVPPVSLRVDFGERVAIVGHNGVGKSTLLKALTGEAEPLEGSVHVGRALRVGDLAQEHESLPRGATPRLHLAEATALPPFDAGQRLIRFGLTLQQVDRPIGELNPGARARLLLATFALRKANCLVLDEPTNHLDEEGVREVVATLRDYTGTVVLVSHSRDFLASVDLTRTLRLSAEGLTEVESVDAFVKVTEEAVHDVLRASMPGGFRHGAT